MEVVPGNFLINFVSSLWCNALLVNKTICLSRKNCWIDLFLNVCLLGCIDIFQFFTHGFHHAMWIIYSLWPNLNMTLVKSYSGGSLAFFPLPPTYLCHSNSQLVLAKPGLLTLCKMPPTMSLWEPRLWWRTALFWWTALYR